MSPRRTARRALVVGLTLALAWSAGGAVLVPATAAAAPSDGLVISEAYGGGGNGGATWRRDFVELGNPSGAALPVDDLTVQYLPGSPRPASPWQVTTLSGSVPPQGRYLVAQAAGAGGTRDLPAPDATGAVAMAAASGTVALVEGPDPLTCRTAADCAAEPRIVDLVGYGGAAVREGDAAPAPSNTTSVARPASLVDTDDNAADFGVGAPTPQNASGEAPGEDPGPPGPQPPGEPGPQRIHDIQGTTRVSPLLGQRVEAVPGIVTAARVVGNARGYWIQDPEPDDDPRTSEGLFVFTGQVPPPVAVGDDVLVSGTVDQFRPGSRTGPNQSVTQLVDAIAAVRSSGNPLPAAEALAPDTVPQRWAPEPGGDISDLTLDPARFALDFYASREGMRIALDDARVVGPTTRFDEFWLTSKPRQNPTVRGGTAYTSYADPNSGRIKVESLVPAAERPFPRVDVNDRVAGTTAGVLDYDGFGGATIMATEIGEIVDGGLVPETTRRPLRGEVAVAAVNVQNLAPTDPPERFAAIGATIARNLAAPHVVALAEVQDDSGPVDDGVVSDDRTLGLLSEAIVAAGGPRYEWRSVHPVDGTTGGQPGGNIRNAFLFDPARVSFVDRPGGTATEGVQVLPRRSPRGAILSASPALIDPGNPAWVSSRRPLVGEFSFRGRPFVVVANHFTAKGGDQPLHGRIQPPVRSSEARRHAQAEVVRAFTDRIDRANRFWPTPVLVAGDLNDFEFSRTLRILTEPRTRSLLPFTRPLRNTVAARPRDDRYTFVFDGNSQTLDHILHTDVLRPDHDIVHTDVDFADQAIDHDPQVLRFRLFP